MGIGKIIEDLKQINDSLEEQAELNKGKNYIEIIENQTIKWNMNDYTNQTFKNCIVKGNMNKIGTMIWWKIKWNMNKVKIMVGGEISWNMNKVDYGSSIKYKWNMNKTLHHFIHQEEKKLSEEESKLPPDIREALAIRNEAIQMRKEIVTKTKKIEKRKKDYYIKYWTLLEKTQNYLSKFLVK